MEELYKEQRKKWWNLDERLIIKKLEDFCIKSRRIN